jgi:hypothetical protein
MFPGGRNICGKVPGFPALESYRANSAYLCTWIRIWTPAHGNIGLRGCVRIFLECVERELFTAGGGVLELGKLYKLLRASLTYRQSYWFRVTVHMDIHSFILGYVQIK